MPSAVKPSQGERRRARDYARAHGVTYADALRSIRATPQAPRLRYLYVPLPVPLLDPGDTGCRACGGTGVNGTLYAQASNSGQLLCDQICAECDGCGSARCQCPPLWLDDGLETDRDEDDDVHADAGFDPCPSCRDRGYHLVQTFDPDDPGADPWPLRIPCGCLTDFVIDVTDEIETRQHYQVEVRP